jgi:hypothetical protein
LPILFGTLIALDATGLLREGSRSLL